MSYKVLRRFIDGENGKPWPQSQGGFFYEIGDAYPKEGFEPTMEHIAYLLSSDNKLKAPCIEGVEQPDKGQGAPLAKMKKAELEAVAADMGLDAQGKTVKELITLIEQALTEKEGGGTSGTTGAAETPPEPDGQ